MSSLIDRALPDGRRIADIVFGPADTSRLTLNFVDVGARNGNYLLPDDYAARCAITGFEPNRAEYEKLINNRTDAKLAGLVEPPFRERKYFPHAVWSEAGERTVYLTIGPSAVTMMGPADQRVMSNMWRVGDRQNFYDRMQKVVGTDTVSCVTIDQIWAGRSDPIDILKLDAEGSELDILKGATDLLRDKRVLLVVAEFHVVPFYERHVTLGHQQVLLDELGYRMIALDLNHAPYSWGKTGISAQNDRMLRCAGDAVFVVDPDRHPMDAATTYRLGLACMAMGFNAFGLNLIRTTGLIPAADIEAIEAEANRPPLKRRLRMAWMNVPDQAVRLLGRMRRWLPV